MCINGIVRLALVLLLGGATAAYAHALLDHANPAVGSTVPTAPSEVSLTFTEKVEPAFSTVEVRDATGHRVDQGDLRRDAMNATVMRVSLKPLVPGSYQVIWRVISVDTHRTEGKFTFHVNRP